MITVRGIIVFLFALIGIAVFFFTISGTKAEPLSIRKQFFSDSKKSVLFSRPGQTVNCCGKGDAVKVKVIGRSRGGMQAVMITDTMRHAFAGKGKIKVGAVLTVHPSKIAKWPRVPELFKSHIVFVYSDGRVICFMQKSAGG